MGKQNTFLAGGTARNQKFAPPRSLECPPVRSSQAMSNTGRQIKAHKSRGIQGRSPVHAGGAAPARKVAAARLPPTWFSPCLAMARATGGPLPRLRGTARVSALSLRRFTMRKPLSERAAGACLEGEFQVGSLDLLRNLSTSKNRIRSRFQALNPQSNLLSDGNPRIFPLPLEVSSLT